MELSSYNEGDYDIQQMSRYAARPQSTAMAKHTELKINDDTLGDFKDEINRYAGIKTRKQNI